MESGVCSHADVEVCPNNDLWCVGFVLCDEPTDSCIPTGSPCYDWQTCNEDLDVCEDLTAIDLLYFAGEESGGVALLSWATASEPDNAGFHVLRAAGVGDDFQRITPTLIPAEGDPIHGAEYEWIDVDVVAGSSYRYLLQDVDIRGNVSHHGPVDVTISEAPGIGCAVGGQVGTVGALGLMALTVLIFHIRRRRRV